MKYWLAVAIVLVGCTDDKAQSSRTVSVDTTPVMDIYDRDATEEPIFEHPAGGMRFSNGNIVINDYYAAKVLYFDSTGRSIRILGGHGQGPNEFGGATTWVGACGRDSAYVFIFGRGKVAVFDSAGHIARMFSPNPKYGTGWCDYDGHAVFLKAEMTRIPRKGDPPLKGRMLTGSLEKDDPREFGTFLQRDYGPLRPFVQAVRRKAKVFIGTGVDGTIDVYSAAGKKIKTLDTGARPQQVTEARYDAALEQFVAYLVLRDERLQMKKLFDERYGKPSKTPAYKKFYVDYEGVLWVDLSQPGENSTFRIINVDDGSVIGTAVFPFEVTVFEIGRHYLLGYYEDGEGFPHVVMHHITRI